MGDIFDLETWRQIIVSAFRQLGNNLAVFMGVLVGRFVRGVVTSGAVVVDVARAERFGAAIGGLVSMFFAVVALEQLGVETTLLVVLLTVLVGGVTFTMGIALALGARPVMVRASERAWSIPNSALLGQVIHR